MQRVFFDTNFLLRYYLNDIPLQADKAKNMIEAAINGSIELVTDLVVICEMVWVMDSYYELDRNTITEKIHHLYQTPGIHVINGSTIPGALTAFLERNVDFTDAVIATDAIKNDIKYIASFDKKHMSRWRDLKLERIDSLEKLSS